MKKFIIVIILILIAGFAYAQSTAEQVQLGYLTIVNGQTVWQPYSASNPLYVTSN